VKWSPLHCPFKLNDLNPEAYLRFVIERIADHPITRSIASKNFFLGTSLPNSPRSRGLPDSP
jgi:hypothetical protein